MARYRDVSNHTPGGGVDNGFCYIKNLCRHIQGLNLTNKLLLTSITGLVIKVEELLLSEFAFFSNLTKTSE